MLLPVCRMEHEPPKRRRRGQASSSNRLNGASPGLALHALLQSDALEAFRGLPLVSLRDTVADGVFATASSDATSDSVSAGLAVGVLRGLPLVSLRDTVAHGVPPIAATDAPCDSVSSILASEALHGLPWVSLQDTAVEGPPATASTGATPECVDPLGDGARRPFQGLPSLRLGDAVAAGASATASMDATSEGFGVVPQGISCGISGVDAALVQERRVGAWLLHSTPSWLRVVWEVLRDLNVCMPLTVMHDCEGINAPGEALRLLRLHGCFKHREQMVAASDIDAACRRWNLLHHARPAVLFTDMMQRDFGTDGASVDAFTGAPYGSGARTSSNSGISSCVISRTMRTFP